jgi:RNA polymerase sigma-70 factor (ECF subfamily)
VEDQALIPRIVAGDEEAMKSLYDLYAAAVFTLALRMLDSREEAEEVLQDTFVRMFASAGRYRPQRGSVKTYLYTIARNLTISRLRARNSRPRKALGHDLHDPSWSWSHQPAADGVTRIAVRDALAQLSAEEVALLEDAFYRGYSHSQLAERSGMPLGTLKSKLRRALLKMRAMLEER